jgi:phage terminase small subunit
MTTKQKLAVKNMVENGGNVSKAMRDAGYSVQTAKSPSKLTSSAKVQSELAAMLEAKGITLNRTLDIVDDALNAERQNQYTGEVSADHNTRLRAAKMVHDLMGIGTSPNTKPDPLTPPPTHANPQTSEELAKALEQADEIKLNQIIFKKDA